jgi:hypothetical protein
VIFWIHAAGEVRLPRFGWKAWFSGEAPTGGAAAFLIVGTPVVEFPRIAGFASIEASGLDESRRREEKEEERGDSAAADEVPLPLRVVAARLLAIMLGVRVVAVQQGGKLHDSVPKVCKNEEEEDVHKDGVTHVRKAHGALLSAREIIIVESTGGGCLLRTRRGVLRLL